MGPYKKAGKAAFQQPSLLFFFDSNNPASGRGPSRIQVTAFDQQPRFWHQGIMLYLDTFIPLPPPWKLY